jgi:type II restriction enzyme
MNSFIHEAKDLVTSHEQTRAGFIEAALEKNIKAQPYIEAARTLKAMASEVDAPIVLLDRSDIMPSLLTASVL